MSTLVFEIIGSIYIRLETSRAGSARFGSVVQRAEPGSARQFHEPIEEARLGSLSARELARAGSRATAAHCITEQFL